MKKKNHLKLVPFNPDDFNANEVLNREFDEILKSTQDIGSALSLYFTWAEHRSSFSKFPQMGSIPCILDYDRDEGTPTELKIQFIEKIDLSQIFPDTPFKIF